MEWIRVPFRKLGEFLTDRILPDETKTRDSKLFQEIIQLAAGRKQSVRDYYIRKVEYICMILILGFLAAGIAFYVGFRKERVVEEQMLSRPGHGEGDRREELEVQIEGLEEIQTLEIRIQEQKYTEAEKKRLLEQAVRELEEALPGENHSLDEVRKKLEFPETLADGSVEVGWYTSPYGILDSDGTILDAEEEEGILVEIQAVLNCAGKEEYYSTFARVYPPETSEEEILKRMILRQTKQADERDSYSASLKLPEEINGKRALWKYPHGNFAGNIAVLTLVLAVCVYIGMDERIHQRAVSRMQQLETDYPEVLWKLSMLIGAGLTIKGAFYRIVNQYRKGAVSHRYIYEEMTAACYEMQSGIPESEAYERFGKRCRLPQYIRLGSYLSHNLKKGSTGLAEFLMKEASDSMEERKNKVRELGEKAGTRMLLPMFLMLIIVLVILMVPAFLSF